MQRPFTKGPRSLIRTVTLRPLECEVTVTSEPNGLVRWAAVIAVGFIRSPDAVGRRYSHSEKQYMSLRMPMSTHTQAP
jgi:hypothetical protein